MEGVLCQEELVMGNEDFRGTKRWWVICFNLRTFSPIQVFVPAKKIHFHDSIHPTYHQLGFNFNCRIVCRCRGFRFTVSWHIDITDLCWSDVSYNPSWSPTDLRLWLCRDLRDRSPNAWPFHDTDRGLSDGVNLLIGPWSAARHDTLRGRRWSLWQGLPYILSVIKFEKYWGSSEINGPKKKLNLGQKLILVFCLIL